MGSGFISYRNLYNKNYEIKYLAGGLIKGLGGKAVKSFMKSDLTRV